jgi:hypothetical protein
VQDLLSWSWIVGAALALVGLAFAALQITRSSDEIRIAKGCFLLSAFILGARIVVWGITTSRSFTFRIIACFIGVGSVGVLVTEAIRYLNRRSATNVQSVQSTSEAGKTAPQALQSQSTYIDPNLPLVVEVVVDQKKQLRIDNKGKIPITDIAISGTTYRFNRKEWEHKRLKIETVQKPSSVALNIQEIREESSSAVFDLRKVPFFDFEDWDIVVERTPENRKSLDDAFLKYYCLRITFRDSRSGMRYVNYKVIGTILDAPSVVDNLERTAIGGPARRIFLQDIPEALINHQRQLYKNDSAKEINY